MHHPRKHQSKTDEASPRPLSCVPAGQRVRIAGIRAGGAGLTHRLTAMGLLPNVEITVVNNGHPGPFIVSIKESKLVMGWGMADKILVL